MKVRQMCGGGTWARADLTTLRRPSPGVTIWDFAGIALVGSKATGDWGPFHIRLHGQFRDRVRERLPQVFRAGWPDRQNPRHPFRRTGPGWVRIGPYVVGRVDLWDESGAA